GCVGAMAELQSPKPVDLDRPAGCRMKQANSFEFTIRRQRIWIKRMNATVSKIAHEQIATKPAKAPGCQCQPPGRIEFTRGRDALNQVAVQIISVDETIPRSRYVVFRVRVLKRVSYVQSVANRLNPKWGKACRKIWIGEVPG